MQDLGNLVNCSIQIKLLSRQEPLSSITLNFFIYTTPTTMDPILKQSNSCYSSDEKQ